MSIKELIEQPVLVSQVSLTPISDPFITKLALPGDIFTASPFIKDKLKGYLGLKGDIVLRLTINADKHTSGRLITFHHPPVAAGTALSSRHHHEDHQLSTQMPNVQIDLNSETECLLRVPHCSPYSHFNLFTGEGDWGHVEIRKLLPVRGNEISITVFAAFEQVELIGPTGVGGFIAQANFSTEASVPMRPRVRRSSSAVFRDKVKTYVRFFREFLAYLVFGKYTAQGTLETEQQNKPLSSRLQSVSSVATTLSGVPLLSSFFSPLAWATATASKVASAFGYSKPLNTKSAEVYVTDPFHGFGHFDGVDWAQPVALSGQAGVHVDTSLGTTDQDEMSIKFLTQIKSSIHRIEWGIGAVAGTRLFTMPLMPKALCARSGHYAKGAAYVAHPIYYLSNMFEYYRGSLEITVVISKTVFHTGRLMLVFEPGNSQPDTVGEGFVKTLADVNPCHKDIVDIRTTNTFSVTLPFTSLTPYLSKEIPYGHFHLFVVNPLVRNSESATDVVDAMIFVNGCDDWEFNGPTEPKLWPLEVWGLDKAADRSDDCFTLPDDPSFVSESTGFVAQGGLEVTKSETEGFRKPIGTSRPPVECHKSAAHCMGEKVTSVKQLAMRAKMVSKYGYKLPLDPFGVSPIFTTPFDANPGMDYLPVRDFYSYVGALYHYSRGGIIISAWNHGSSISKIQVTNSYHSLQYDPIYKGAGDMFLEKWFTAQQCTRVYIPPYHNGLRRYTYGPRRAGDDRPDRRDAGVSNVRFAVRTFHNTIADESNSHYNSKAFIWRSAAEDTQFGFFVGVPLLTTANTGPGVIDGTLVFHQASSL